MVPLRNLLTFAVAAAVLIAGAAYLVYLGIQAIRHRGRSTTAADPSRSASTLSFCPDIAS